MCLSCTSTSHAHSNVVMHIAMQLTHKCTIVTGCLPLCTHIRPPSQAFADHIVLLAIILIPMTMSQTLLDTVSSSTITKCVPESETGTALGLNMATRSIIGILAPTTGGYMYSWFGYPSFGLLGFIFNGVMAVYMSIFGGIPLQYN